MAAEQSHVQAALIGVALDGSRPVQTGATHCFICAHLAAAHNLAPSGQQGPGSVTTAATGGTRDSDLAASMQIFLSLGDVLCESLSVSPIDMDVGYGTILGWDWISSHDLRHLYADGQASLRSGPALLQLDLLPASARPAARLLPPGDRPRRVSQAPAPNRAGGPRGLCIVAAEPAAYAAADPPPLDGMVATRLCRAR